MRICLLADAGSIHIHQLSRELVAGGHSVHVVSHKPGIVPGATVERFHVPRPGFGNLRRWEARRQRYLRSILRRHDIVNIHFLSDWGFDRGFELWESGCVVVTPWGSDIVDPPGENPATNELRALRRQMLQRAALVTTCGAHFGDRVASWAGIDRARVHVAPFGVDCDLFAPPQRAPVQMTAPTIGFFKGFRHVYGPDIWLRALPLVRRRYPRAKFPMIGEGPSHQECQVLARALGVFDAIEWLPRQSHACLPVLLASWSLSVMPSIQEAFGVAALESAALRVPVVASDVCGFRDTVMDGKTGVLVRPSDSKALATAVTRLLDDQESRLEMARFGRQWVRGNFHWPNLRAVWDQAFQAALDHVRSTV